MRAVGEASSEQRKADPTRTSHPKRESLKSQSRFTAALLLLALAGCGPLDDTGDDEGTPDSGTGTAPELLSSAPENGATEVALNAAIRATFSEDMEPGSLSAETFRVTSDTSATPIAGTVIYGSRKASFWPETHLSSASTYTVTITTGATSLGGVPLGSDQSWSFTTGNSVEPGAPVELGTAGLFVILAKSGVSTVPNSVIVGDVGVSPAAASYVTGFSLTADASNTFATSPQITGKVYAADQAAPTPSKMTTAIGDMELAFTDAAGRAPDVIELGAGDIGGMTLPAGVYQWGTGLLIPADVTLTGSATDVWIFQIAQDLTVSSGKRVTLAGGALPKNVFWQVAGAVELGTTAHLEGVVLTQTSATLRTGASLNGRMLAQTAVDLDSATVIQPAP